MPFIRSVRVTDPGTASEHIVAVQYSVTPDGPVTVASADAIARTIAAGAAVYAPELTSGGLALVIPRPAAGGRQSLTAVARGRATDALLDLPRF